MDKYQSIKDKFEEVADSAKAAEMAAYMRNMFVFYGIPAPKRKEICREFLKAERKNGEVDWDFVDRCWDDEHREFQYVAADYLKQMQKFLTYDDVVKLERLVRTKQWWDTIDGLDRIIGGIAFVDSRIDGLMLRWSEDDDFWVRRVAIDHQLCRKEKTDKRLLEAILVNNFGSDEFFINKAIGWSLRDFSRTDPRWVKAFIEKYHSRMSRLSIREASKYLS